MRNSIFFLFLILFTLFFPAHASAGILDDLRNLISNRAHQIKELNREIEEYKERVEETQEEAKTLEGELDRLDVSERRLRGNIKTTQGDIQETASSIFSLETEIIEKRREIKENVGDLSQTLRILHELESQSLVEIIFSGNSFSAFWDNVENIERFQASVQTSLRELSELERALEEKRDAHEKERRSLIAHQQQLSNQRLLVEINQEEKARLLEDTKNKEANYQQILEVRLAKKEALEKEILEFEERLRIEIDPNSLPSTGTGVLRWPLDSLYITQYFGTTPFATANPQVYNGGGHNGIDFRASVGTPVRSSSGGIVRGVADTDSQCYRVSYGKWILVEHFNGLSTLYAHLSLQSVSVGQEVQEGQIIGYSGNTGYSTGPHLHFAVFATKAVGISGQDTEKYISRVCGVELTLPLSAKNGYLNPLSYLPRLE
ncbi:MAG: peptidoglycan DD-metalloendopeptidase family protein [Candidatus Paceibacterota bacterium]